MDDDNLPATEIEEKLISSFTEITSSSREEASSYLETHQWDLDAAADPSGQQLLRNLDARTRFSNLRIDIPHSSSDESSDSDSAPSSSKSPSHPSRTRYPLLSKCQHAGNIRPVADISGGTDSDSDEAQEYYGGREESGTMAQDLKTDGESDVERPVGSRRTTFRINRDEPTVTTFDISIWRNGFTVDDSPLETFENLKNPAFVEMMKNVESQHELNLRYRFIRRQEDFPVSPQPVSPFHGVGRTLAESGSAEQQLASSDTLTTEPPQSISLVVDPAAPTTSIQIRLADGTSINSQFNTHHTVRDVRSFIDESRPGGSRDYQLLIMEFPPKPLPDFDQTIQNAGISNSVLIQKY